MSLQWYRAAICCWKKTQAGYTRQVTNALQHFTKIFSFIIWLGLMIAWQFLLEFVWRKNYCDLVSLLSTYFGAYDSLITKINGFQSVTNILDLFLDLFWDWLCTSHEIHLEPRRVRSNAFCINDAASCNIWKHKLGPSISLWKSFQTVYGLSIFADHRVWLLTLESSSIALKIPNDACTTLRQKLIGCSKLS